MKLKKINLLIVLALGASTNAIAETAPVEPATMGEISNLAELRWYSETPSAHSGTWTLTSDIDASETKMWNLGDHDENASTPDEYMGFLPIDELSGVFDGGGKTISNLYIKRKQSSTNSAFIGSTFNGYLKNLTLHNIEVYGNSNTAAAVGDLYMGKISNVHITGDGSVDGGESSFTSKIVASDFGSVGAIAGNTTDGIIENVSVKAVVKGDWEIGGIVGNATTISIENAKANVIVYGSSSVGGAVGSVNESSLSDVEVIASVIPTDNLYSDNLGLVAGSGYVAIYENITAKGSVIGNRKIGGLEGDAYESSYSDININASVTATGDDSERGEAGGIAGAAYMNKPSSNIHFKGDITGTDHVGGYLGEDSSSGDVNSVYIDAKITGRNNVGGLIGLSDSQRITNASVDGEITGVSNVGGLIGEEIGSFVGTDIYISTTLTTTGSASNVDSLFGQTTVPVLNRVFFDTEVNNYADAYGTGLTTKEMKDKSSFPEWTWTNAWNQNRWSMPDGEYAHLTLGTLPVFTSPTEDEGKIADISIDAGDSINLQVAAIDSTPEGQAVTYRLNIERIAEEGTPEANTAVDELAIPDFIKIDDNGHITGSTSNTDIGKYYVTVFAELGEYENSLQPFKVSVNKVDLPEPDLPEPEPDVDDNKKDGGSLSWLALLALTPMAYSRRRKLQL